MTNTIRWVVVLLMPILAGCYNQALDYKNLVTNNVSIVGRIAAVNCWNHGAVYYSFDISGVERRGRIPAGLVQCSTAKVGDQVIVFYDPGNPNINTVMQPGDAYERARGWYIPEWFWYLFPPVFVVVFGTFMELRRGRADH